MSVPYAELSDQEIKELNKQLSIRLGASFITTVVVGTVATLASEKIVQMILNRQS